MKPCIKTTFVNKQHIIERNTRFNNRVGVNYFLLDLNFPRNNLVVISFPLRKREIVGRLTLQLLSVKLASISINVESGRHPFTLFCKKLFKNVLFSLFIIIICDITSMGNFFYGLRVNITGFLKQIKNIKLDRADTFVPIE